MMPQIIRLFIIGFVSLFICFSFLKTGKSEKSETKLTKAFDNHPIYSDYKFDNREDVINIGIQPLYSPTGLITETIKRDNILLKALSRLGMTIKYYAFLKGDDINHFLCTNELDGGVGGDMPAISASVITDVIVTNLVQLGFSSIVAARPMYINELRGDKIGYAFGSQAHYALLHALTSHELSTNHVHLIPMEVNEMPEALCTGKIIAFSSWEPIPTIALKKCPKSIVINRHLSSGYVYFLKKFFYKHPEAVRQIICSEIRA